MRVALRAYTLYKGTVLLVLDGQIVRIVINLKEVKGESALLAGISSKGCRIERTCNLTPQAPAAASLRTLQPAAANITKLLIDKLANYKRN